MISLKSAGFKSLDSAYLRISKEISSTIPGESCGLSHSQSSLMIVRNRMGCYCNLHGIIDWWGLLWIKLQYCVENLPQIELVVKISCQTYHTSQNFNFLCQNSIEVRICFFSLRFTSPPASCPGDKLEISALGLCTSSVSLSVKFQFFLY